MLSFQRSLLLLLAVTTANLGITACQNQPRLQAEAQAPTITESPAASPFPAASPSPAQSPERQPDVPYVPTPQAVVDEMLRVAQVNRNDKLYDLGSGDGRIVITAARQYGTRGVGIDINPERIQEANANAREAGVTNQVEFRQQDLFKTDLRDATVVTLYLLPAINLRLRPKLLQELKPGTRIVSHAFDMGDWQPDRVVKVGDNTIYFWTVPKTIPDRLRQ